MEESSSEEPRAKRPKLSAKPHPVDLHKVPQAKHQKQFFDNVSLLKNSKIGLEEDLQATLLRNIVSLGGIKKATACQVCNLHDSYRTPNSSRCKQVQNKITRWKGWPKQKFDKLLSEIESKDNKEEEEFVIVDED